VVVSAGIVLMHGLSAPVGTVLAAESPVHASAAMGHHPGITHRGPIEPAIMAANGHASDREQLHGQREMSDVRALAKQIESAQTGRSPARPNCSTPWERAEM
jgi:hypothetical protein